MPELHIIQQGLLPLRTTDEAEIFESPASLPARLDVPKAPEDLSAPPAYYAQEPGLIDNAPNDLVVARQFFDRHVLLAPVALPGADNVAIRGGATTAWQAGRLRETPSEKLARLKREVEELSLQQQDESSTSDDTVAALAMTLESIRVREQDGAQRPSQTQLLRKISLLEGRLAQLEQQHTSSQTTGPITQASLSQNNMSAANFALLVRQLALLTASDDARAKFLQRFSPLAASTKVLKEHPQAAQLESTMTAIREIQAHATLVEPVLDRLRDLQDIHHDAAQSASLIAVLEQSLQDRQAEIDRWQRAVDTLQASIEDSAKAMESNKNTVKATVDALRKVLSELAST
jgi:hypothetical protein